jgi:hypothetical protein
LRLKSFVQMESQIRVAQKLTDPIIDEAADEFFQLTRGETGKIHRSRIRSSYLEMQYGNTQQGWSSEKSYACPVRAESCSMTRVSRA